MANNNQNNNYSLTDKEFFTQACRWADAKNLKTAANWWDAFVEVIVREIFYTGTCRLPNIGTIHCKIIAESLQVQKTPQGREVVYRVPERMLPNIFVPEDHFVNDVNMQGITKQFRKRLKKGMLTQRDWERQARAESLNIEGSLSKERIEKAQAEFKELLENKKKKFKGKAVAENDEDEQ